MYGQSSINLGAGGSGERSHDDHSSGTAHVFTSPFMAWAFLVSEVRYGFPLRLMRVPQVAIDLPK
jgi:hypothetical protein